MPSPPLTMPLSMASTHFLNTSKDDDYINHFPGLIVPMFGNSFQDEFFPNSQSKPLFVQLEVDSFCLFTCDLEEEADPHLTTAFFQAIVESEKVSWAPFSPA